MCVCPVSVCACLCVCICVCEVGGRKGSKETGKVRDRQTKTDSDRRRCTITKKYFILASFKQLMAYNGVNVRTNWTLTSLYNLCFISHFENYFITLCFTTSSLNAIICIIYRFIADQS